MATHSPPSFVVISGGTGCNALIGAFLPPRSTSTSFILPISDDGGSSSEIQRVLGGPSIGDIRSRLVRLIPDSPCESPLAQIRTLLEYRLPGTGSSAALKSEWHTIVEGRHHLWKGIPNDRKECIRAFLVHFESAVLKKAQRGFDWKRASIGNIFLTGASMFLGSIPSAIFLFSSICSIPHETSRVIPVINTSSTATIAAELENDEIIVGQSEISHPSPGTTPLEYYRSPTPAHRPATPTNLQTLLLQPPPSPGYASRAPTPSLFEGPILGDEDPPHSDYQGSDDEDADAKPGARSSNVVVDKDHGPSLPARIRRIFYLNAYGSETFPRANPLFLESLATASCLVYSCGSLYTSVIPCLALRGVGTAIRTSPSLKQKVLLLNGTHDRETPGYDAKDFVEAIRSALSEHDGELLGGRTRARDFLTHVVYIEEGEIAVDILLLEGMGIHCIPARANGLVFDSDSVHEAFDSIFSETV